jgi:hypothetical protein
MVHGCIKNVRGGPLSYEWSRNLGDFLFFFFFFFFNAGALRRLNVTSILQLNPKLKISIQTLFYRVGCSTALALGRVTWDSPRVAGRITSSLLLVSKVGL